MDCYTLSEIEIYIWEQGVVLREPALLAFDREHHRILAVGRGAEQMQYSDAELKCPLKNGQIADWDDALKMFKYFFLQTWKKRLKRPKVAVCMAEGATEVEKISMKEMMAICGAKSVCLSELPLGQFIHTTDKKDCDIVIGIR